MLKRMAVADRAKRGRDLFQRRLWGDAFDELSTAHRDDGRGRRADNRAPTFASGQEMWDWVLYGNPIPGMLVADLSEDQRTNLRQVLDGMVRERSGANGRTELKNAVNIGLGTK
jgi:hypothetical protein